MKKFITLFVVKFEKPKRSYIFADASVLSIIGSE